MAGKNEISDAALETTWLKIIGIVIQKSEDGEEFIFIFFLANAILFLMQ